MSLEENASPWKKRERQTSSLADDQKNRFQRHEEAIAAQRRDTSAHDERVAHRESQRAAWTHQGGAPKTAGGLTLDAVTAQLKAASDADRAARRNPVVTREVVVPTRATVQAIAAGFAHATPDFYASDFNVTNMENCFWSLFFAGEVELSVEGFARVFEYLKTNNFYDDVPSYTNAAGQLIRPRGVRFSPPKPYPTFMWPDQVEAQAQEDLTASVQQSLAEAQAAKAKPFSELQQEVRKGYAKNRPHNAPETW